MLNELRTNTLSNQEREKKENELKDKAEKLQGQIDGLAGQEIDTKLSAEKERAETILNNCNEILKLKSSIVDGNKTDKKETPSKSVSTEKVQASTQSEIQTTSTPEEKGFIGKAGEWILEKWSAIPGRGKGVFGAVTAAIAGSWIYKKLFGKKDKKEGGDGNKDKKDNNKEKEEQKKQETPRWKKFLTRTGIATGTVVGGVSIYKNWNRISSWVKEKLGIALSFEEAMYTVETEVRNGINSDNNFGEFSAHFNGMSYDENTHEISSFGEQTKINKSKKSIEGMDDVQFASWEELFHAVNIVNFAKRELKGRGANETPFSINSTTGDIDFTLSESGRSQFIGANGSNFWTWVLGLGGAGGGGLLGGYFLGIKGGLTGGVAGGLAGYTLGSVIDNTSTMGRACGTIAKGANLQKFVKYLNEQNIWGEQKEVYKPDNTTPIHKYLNIVKHEINDAYGYGGEDTAKRDLKVEWNESQPEIYKIKSYKQEISIRLEGCTAKKGEEIDFSKITKIRMEKYERIDERNIASWGDGLDIDFPKTEEGLKEVIRTANLTNKIVNDRKRKGGEKYPFFWGKYTTPPSLDMDTDGFRGKTILSRDSAEKFPTLFEDLKKGSSGGMGSAVGYTKSHQTEMHDQAIQDKDEGSQYIKFLHQIGQGRFWKKVG